MRHGRFIADYSTINDFHAAAGIDISFDSSVTELVSKEGFDPVYGARPLRRAIVRMIEDTVSTEMLEGKIKKGDAVSATAEDGKIVFKKA